MNRGLIDTLARAVLYEGYILYPYRRSVKNQQRWTFGGIYPEAWSAASEGSDPCLMQTQCLVGGATARVRIVVRFLHLAERTVGELVRPVAELPVGGEPEFRGREMLEVGGKRYESWQESVEREVDAGTFSAAELADSARGVTFSFPCSRTIEAVRDGAGMIAAVVVREQQAVSGAIDVSAERLAKDLYRLTVKIRNVTEMPGEPRHAWHGRPAHDSPRADSGTRQGNPSFAAPLGGRAGTSRAHRLSADHRRDTDATITRDTAVLHSFASTHIILEAQEGEFASLTDPPKALREQAAACQNIGAWPVLVGVSPARDTMLCSPIILPDYPEVAPESPGDLFDATEIDEILTLRILTLTEDEKRSAMAVDERTAALLARTESLARDQLANLHGTFRPIPEQLASWNASAGHDPFAGEAEQQRLQEAATPGGHVFKIGDRVLLHPRRSADIFDLALAGKIATIVRIEQDYENRIHLAVTVDDDPGSDLGRDGKIGHRFFFGIDEVEALGPEIVSNGKPDP